MTPENRQRAILIIADLLSTGIAVCIFNIYRHSLLAPQTPLLTYLASPMVVAGQILFPLMMLAISALSGYYNSPIQRSRLQDLLTTFGSCIAATMLILLLALIDDLTADRARDYSLFAALFLILFVCISIPRAIITSITARRLRQGHLQRPVAIIAYGSQPERITRLIQSLRPSIGLKPVVISTLDNILPPDIPGITPISPDDIESVCQAEGINTIILLPHPSSEWRPNLDAIRRFMRAHLTVKMPHDPELMPLLHTRHLDVPTEPLINVTNPYNSPSTQNLKRTADFIISLTAIAVLALPVGLICAAIWATTGDSPIYRQPRLGLRGRTFQILKLRTMRPNSEPDGTPLLSHPDDPRVTPIGAFLRKYRFDELPQFINVLLGHMSIVGPRPERPHFAEQIIERNPFYIILSQVRPGITSWGMVKYGYASSIDQMIQRMNYDLLYVQNLSFALDLKILFYTLHTVITGKGI